MFHTIEIAGSVLAVAVRDAIQAKASEVFDDNSTVARAVEQLGRFHIGLQYLVQPRQVWNFGFEGGICIPNLGRIAIRRVYRIRKESVVILGVHGEGHTGLTQVGNADDGPRCRSRLGEDGKEQRGQNGNNRNHDKQLDEGEPSSTILELIHRAALEMELVTRVRMWEAFDNDPLN